jgi:general secretion pathway protein J
MRRHADAEAGFTLIEVLIGITLLAMLGTVIASGVRLGGRAWNDAERQTANSDDMVLVQNLFRRTIVRARPAFISDDPRDLTVSFTGEAGTLSLIAPQPGTPFGGPWVNERFYVAPNGASRALFVALQRDGAPAAASGIVLLDHVATVRFAYFGSSEPGEPASWQESWTNRARLPDLVRVAVVRDTPRLSAWPELVVATRVTANAGCVFSALSSGCRRTQ